MSVQMIIGDFPFSVDTSEYDKLTRQLSWRWLEHERLGRKPALQYQGPGLIAVTLSGTIHVQSTIQLEQPQAMQAEAGKGEPLDLLASNDTLKANYHGLWVITDMTVDESALLGDGTPVTIEFSMNIKEYGED